MENGTMRLIKASLRKGGDKKKDGAGDSNYDIL
jgi:hypothetical protein